MRTVPFQNVLHGAARLLGLDVARDLSSARAASITEYINAATRPAWQFDWWPEMMECEERHWRNAYVDGEFLAAGDERHHTGSGAYYIALREQIAATQAPASHGAGVWTENSAWWAACKTSYSAAPQVVGETLAVGDQRLDIETGKFYQAHTAHVAASASVDLTKCGEIIPFARYISLEQEGRTPIGAVKGIHQRDPRVFPGRSGQMNHRLNHRGALVNVAGIPARVWVEFRLRPPVFTSSPWVSGTAYDLGALVYYQGGVFKSAIGNNDQPVDGVVNWIEVGFPEILAETVKLAAAAMGMTDQKQQSRAAALRAQAQDELERTREQEITSQQEPEMAEVRTY